MKDIKEWCRGDGIRDDTNGLKAALNSGESIEVSPGVYRITSPIISHNPSVHMEGAGGASIFKFENCDGFKFNLPSTEYYSDSVNGLVLKNFHLKTNSYNKTGMIIRCEDENDNSNIPTMVDGITFSGVSPQTTHWAKNLVYSRVGRTTTRSVRIHGPIFLNRSSIGVYYDGDENIPATEHSLSDVKVVGCSTGVWADGWVEGITMSSSHIVACYDGVVASLNHKPQFNINNCHINAWRKGVSFNEVTQSSISNNLFYIDSKRAYDGHAGVVCVGNEYISSDTIITNNTFYHIGENNSQRGTGIDISGSGFIVANNIIKLFEKGILNKSNQHIVKDNLFIYCKEEIA